MRLCDVDVKPRGVSRPHSFSVNIDLRALRLKTSIYKRRLISDDSDYSSKSPRGREFVATGSYAPDGVH
jgi:hypothetical protein